MKPINILENSQYFPIFLWENDHFSPAIKDMEFKLWMNKGMIRLKDLYDYNILMSF